MSTVGSTGCVVDPAETVEVLATDVSQDVAAENSASFSGFSDSTAVGSVLEPGLANRLTSVERQIHALSGLVNKERERSQGLAGSLEKISEELDRLRLHQHSNAGKSADDMNTSPLSETLPQEVSTTLETDHHNVQTCIDEWASKLPKTEDTTTAPKVFLGRPPLVPTSGTASSVMIGSAACSPRSVSGTCSQGCSVSTAPGPLLGSCRVRVTSRTASVHQDGAQRHRSPTAVTRTARSLGPPASQHVVVAGPGNDCADRPHSAVWTCPAFKWSTAAAATAASSFTPYAKGGRREKCQSSTRQISRSISRSVSPGPRRAVSTRPTPPEPLPTVTLHSFAHPSGHVGGTVSDGADGVSEPVQQLPPSELVTLQSVSVLERMQAFEKTPRLRSGRVAIPPLPR